MNGIGSDTVSTVPKATDEVAVSPVTDMSAGISSTRAATRPTYATDPKAALPDGHVTLLVSSAGSHSIRQAF